jgi:hypothetical protein
MTNPLTAGLPMGVPEADLLEQRATIVWPEVPPDEVTGVPRRFTDSSADEGDLLEQAQAAGAFADDDDHPHDSPAPRE